MGVVREGRGVGVWEDVAVQDGAPLRGFHEGGDVLVVCVVEDGGIEEVGC